MNNFKKTADDRTGGNFVVDNEQTNGFPIARKTDWNLPTRNPKNAPLQDSDTPAKEKEQWTKRPSSSQKRRHRKTG